MSYCGLLVATDVWVFHAFTQLVASIPFISALPEIGGLGHALTSGIYRDACSRRRSLSVAQYPASTGGLCTFTYMRTQRLICATSWICPRSHCACPHVPWCEHEDVTMWSIYYRPHWLGP
ncbi:hypothetical protein C8Q74DRAFT_1255102 [Fomes fomentarius]|nr:hypothetical protein C8Q74DRAFT_1255102 [Fomes fomentarius]